MLELNGWDILWTIVNLLVLYLLMRRFLFRPVTAMLDNRTKSIADSLADAEGQKAEAARLKQSYEEQLIKAREHAAAILAEAQERGDDAYNRKMDQARAEAVRLQADTRAQLEAERCAMMESARQEIATLALLAASKVSQRSLDSASDRAFVDDFLSETGDEA